MTSKNIKKIKIIMSVFVVIAMWLPGTALALTSYVPTMYDEELIPAQDEEYSLGYSFVANSVYDELCDYLYYTTASGNKEVVVGLDAVSRDEDNDRYYMRMFSLDEFKVDNFTQHALKEDGDSNISTTNYTYDSKKYDSVLDVYHLTVGNLYINTIDKNVIKADIKIFEDVDSAIKYLQTGSTDGLLHDPDKDLSDDDTLGFTQFEMHRTVSPYIAGGTGGIVYYDFPDGVFDEPGRIWKIHFDVSYNIIVQWGNFSLVNSVSEYESDTHGFSIEIPVSSSSGQYTFDFIQLCNQFGYPSGISGALLKCIGNYSDETTGYVFQWTSRIGYKLITSFLPDIAPEYDTTVHYTCKTLELNVSAYITDGNVKSKTSYGYVDLLTGDNQSMSVPGNDSETGEENEPQENSNTPDVEPTVDPDGNVTYVVVQDDDDDGDTIVNMPSELVLKFANSLNITGIGTSGGSSSSSSSGGGSGGNNYDLTIEDDDYTDSALREDLSDGFGLLDDLSTDEKGDGYLGFVADFYSTLDGNMRDIIMFGVSSTVVIALIRQFLKR